MQNEIATIDFYGDSLVGIMDHTTNNVFAPVKPMCDSLGLVSWRQQQKIQDHRVLSKGINIMLIPSLGGTQSTFCLRIDLIPLWLSTININKVKDGLKEKLEVYQEECAKVLAEHFLGKRREDDSEDYIAMTKALSSADIEEIQYAVKSLHPSIHKLGREAFGYFLLKKKEEIPQGEWMRYLRKIGICDRTARNWMRKCREKLSENKAVELGFDWN